MTAQEKKPLSAGPAGSADSDKEEPCCASPPGSDDGEEEACCASSADEDVASDVPDQFMTFLKGANKPGVLGGREKKLIAIALSVAQRCEPCVRIHLKAAVKMGLPKAEIDEAAWLGIAFAGAPAMMMYKAVCEELDL